MDSSAVPKVSVIIPLYNKAPYIKRALDSVFAQTVQDFEVIVVNDGSKDGGEKIVEEYGDSRIRLINQENQGVSAARNHGVDAARAELVAFLDADDEWLPEFLETILRLREKWPDAGMYYSNSWRLIDGVRVSNDVNTGKEEGIIKNYFRDCALHGHCIDTICVAVQRNVFLSLGGFDSSFVFFEDYDLWDRIAYYYPIAYTPTPLAIYHTEESNANSRILECGNVFNLPFIAYLQSQPEEKVQNRLDYGDILLYIDSLNLMRANIGKYYGKMEAMKYLMKIHSPELRKKKLISIIAVMIPQVFKRPVVKLYHKVVN